MTMQQKIEQFKAALKKMKAYQHAMGVMFYDFETVMPKGAAEDFAAQYYGKNSEELLEKAFKLDEVSGGSINVPGVVSRKKQILPMIVSASNNM